MNNNNLGEKQLYYSLQSEGITKPCNNLVQDVVEDKQKIKKKMAMNKKENVL